jgi:ACR3 family arsenite transporter
LLPDVLGLRDSGETVDITIGELAQNVFIYPGMSMAAGFLARFFLVCRKGRKWYENEFIPRISPINLIALLFTILVMYPFLLLHVTFGQYNSDRQLG